VVAKRKETDQAWKVSIEDIKARSYNLDIKNPRAAGPMGRAIRHELLKQYREAAAEWTRCGRNCEQSWGKPWEQVREGHGALSL